MLQHGRLRRSGRIKQENHVQKRARKQFVRLHGRGIALNRKEMDGQQFPELFDLRGQIRRQLRKFTRLRPCKRKQNLVR